MSDLLLKNGGLTLGGMPEVTFATAVTPADYVTDVVCAVVHDVLRRDVDVAKEDARRMVQAAKSLAAEREMQDDD